MQYLINILIPKIIKKIVHKTKINIYISLITIHKRVRFEVFTTVKTSVIKMETVLRNVVIHQVHSGPKPRKTRKH